MRDIFIKDLLQGKNPEEILGIWSDWEEDNGDKDMSYCLLWMRQRKKYPFVRTELRIRKKYAFYPEHPYFLNRYPLHSILPLTVFYNVSSTFRPEKVHQYFTDYGEAIFALASAFRKIKESIAV